MAYKLGFRWRPVCSAVPTTTTALDTPWSTFPIYTPVPSDPYTPTGSGLDGTWTAPDTPTALPWSTAPVPALPTTTPRTYWRFDRTLDLRNKDQTRPSSSRSTSRPTRPGIPSAPTTPALVAPVLTVAPVCPTGVPGSSHDGVDTVSVVISKNFP